MAHNLTSRIQTIHVMNAVAAGTSSQTSTAVDMQGKGEAIRFIADIGALTATQVTKLGIQESDDNSAWGATIAATQTAAMADGDSNKLLITDLFRPKKRYVRAEVARGTANAVINCVIAEVYRLSDEIDTQDATVSQHVIAANA